MRIITAVLLCCALCTPALADDRADVESTIQTGYIQGVHLERDADKMRAGFHKSFTMFIARDGELSELGRDAWIERIEAWKAEEPELGYETEWEIATVDVTDDAAMAKVLIHRDGELVFTDYLSLYRFPSGWKIVAKTFHDHRP